MTTSGASGFYRRYLLYGLVYLRINYFLWLNHQCLKTWHTNCDAPNQLFSKPHFRIATQINHMLCLRRYAKCFDDMFSALCIILHNRHLVTIRHLRLSRQFYCGWSSSRIIRRVGCFPTFRIELHVLGDEVSAIFLNAGNHSPRDSLNVPENVGH